MNNSVMSNQSSSAAVACCEPCGADARASLPCATCGVDTSLCDDCVAGRIANEIATPFVCAFCVKVQGRALVGGYDDVPELDGEDDVPPAFDEIDASYEGLGDGDALASMEDENGDVDPERRDYLS